jgi:hypothetical protein
MPRPHYQRCSHPTAAGRPCRAWAVRGSDPPLCSAHAGRNQRQHPGGVGAGAPPGNQNHTVHGFYSSALSPAEVADLLAHTGASTLEGEIACARIALRRVLAHLTAAGVGLSPLDYAKLASLAFQGARTVARLVRDNHALGGRSSDELYAIFDQVLDDLSGAWDVDL